MQTTATITKEYWINKLNLQPHPEGGYYTENYRSKDVVEFPDGSMEKTHNASTSIYHLIESETGSFCHKLNTDEVWYYHYGSPITIFMIDPQGNFSVKICGPGEHEDLVVIVPQNNWFGVKVNTPNSYMLASCNVAPGFDFLDLEMADRNELIRKYPQHKAAILHYTLV